MSSELLVGLPPEAMADLKEMLASKASDLFAICDQEEKGFVTKRDMQRMRAELPLDPDQLEAVFDRLDGDQNGYLTLEEFTEGFGEYLGLEPEKKEEAVVEEAVIEVEPELVQEHHHEIELDDEDQFNVMLSELGILGLVEDDTALRDMWLNLKNENDPALVANFEQFLNNLAKDLHKKTTEQEHFENAIKSRSQVQEEHMQRLYEEMEQQIGAERKATKEEEERREARLKEEWESTMQMKDQQLMEVMSRMQELQSQLEETKKEVPSMKQENQTLAKERDKLQSELERQRILHKEVQEHMDAMRNQTAAERKERAKAAFKVSENIAQEREGLVQQLGFMKALNAKMLDDRDITLAESTHSNDLKDEDNLAEELGSTMLPRQEEIREDSLMMDRQESVELYQKSLTEAAAKRIVGQRAELKAPSPLELANTSEYEYDDEYFQMDTMGHAGTRMMTTAAAVTGRPQQRTTPKFKRFHSQPPGKTPQGLRMGDNVSLHEELACMDSGRGSGGSLATGGNMNDSSSRSSLEGDHIDHNAKLSRRHQRNSLGSNGGRFSSSLLIYHPSQSQQQLEKARDFHSPYSGDGFHHLDSATSCTGPISYGESDLTSFNTQNSADFGGHHYVTPLSQLNKNNGLPSSNLDPYEPVRLPERVFKVIFIGDSCVGKSSLIKRFCTGKFEPGLKSTIGVDFHTRSLLVENESICLQCWDTAGQERYRSITHQYFRKADAVIVVYDITAEKSFLNAREWLDSAVEGAGEEASLLLIGNKMDLAEDDLMRKVRKTEGIQLSKSYSTLFGEVSAADGRNVEPTIMELAKLLREREDQHMQKALKLSVEQAEKKDKGCCKKG